MRKIKGLISKMYVFIFTLFCDSNLLNFYRKLYAYRRLKTSYNYEIFKKINKIYSYNNDKFREKSIAIITVFIVKENILFLEERIKHHLEMGIDHIFLYDNSLVQEVYKNKLNFNKKSNKENNAIVGKINKHNINYNNLISDKDADILYKKIINKYKENLTIVPWNKKDENGKIGYFQFDAINDFIEKNSNKYDYCLHIDIDEFMVSRKGLNMKDIVEKMESKKTTSAFFSQRRFLSRYLSAEKQAIKITESVYKDIKAAPKTLFKISAFIGGEGDIHHIRTLFGNNYIDNDDMIFHHYNFNPNNKVNSIFPNLDFYLISKRKMIKNIDALKYTKDFTL